jgi:tetratricopeptide (TPR) repeat protein
MKIPTYPALEPDLNPMFFETRNIQGSKGNIYPHPYIDRLSSDMVDKEYTAVVLENEYLQMIMLPEIGGRIFAGLDKTNGYDFFYRHKVIKPALIGLFGPWISGGVEFNWPQHHRPSTFDPTHFTVEGHPDGSKTVWMGEHDPLNRTKGMVGICLYPGKAFVETKVRLYNRTPFPQTFLWWANAGVHINEQYQVIFPPDVHYAVHHVKNPVTSYPIAKGEFTSGNDYGDGTDVSWWVNSPLPASFFAAESKYEFFGGYDHAWGAGVVHVADANISPGKKFFTWANGPFGHMWQKNLMDDTGEYLELMAGVYTDNQPDFSWIMPHETRTFSQFWYPVQQIGPMKNANLQAAINLEVKDAAAWCGVYAVEVLPNAQITLSTPDQVLFSRTVDLAPGTSFTTEVPLPAGIESTSLLLRVQSDSGEEIIRYQPEGPGDGSLPEPYKPLPAPKDVNQIEQLYLMGLHIDQYRHPTLSPESYWEEALRRDPGDARCNLAMGKTLLRRGLFTQAEEFFRKSSKRLISYNFNPYDGEAHYNLGLALQYQGRLDEAYKAFYKSVWNYAWQSPGYYALAQIDMQRKDYKKALVQLERSLQVNTQSSKARNLKAAALRHIGQVAAAEALASETKQQDLLDFWARYEISLAAEAQGNIDMSDANLSEMKILMRDDVQVYLDITYDLAAAGLYTEAAQLLEITVPFTQLHPMAAYTLGWLAQQSGRPNEAKAWFARAAAASPHYCFPWRLEELLVLRTALDANPTDTRAAYYLGNLLYDKRRYDEAEALWRRSVDIEPGFSIPWRNLGLAAYNISKDVKAALEMYEHAMAANPNDPRLLLEYDHLLWRKGAKPEDRLALLESKHALVNMRDDLIVHQMELYNRLGQPQHALQLAYNRQFHTWEGGEGTVTGQYSYAHWIIGRCALEEGDAHTALEHFQAGIIFPENLGEHPFVESYIYLTYYKGLAYSALKQQNKAKIAFKQVSKYSDGLSSVGIFGALANIKLGKEDEGRATLAKIKQDAEEMAQKPFTSNYFFSGNPNPTFEEDNQKQHYIYSTLLAGLSAVALGDTANAKSTLLQVLSEDPANLLAWEDYKRL